MLEKMDDFFNNRIDSYEEHQLNMIDSAKEFYPFTAKHLPMDKNVSILDLGCGTGLELGYYFELNPTARITGIDISSTLWFSTSESPMKAHPTLGSTSVPISAKAFDILRNLLVYFMPFQPLLGKYS